MIRDFSGNSKFKLYDLRSNFFIHIKIAEKMMKKMLLNYPKKLFLRSSTKVRKQDYGIISQNIINFSIIKITMNLNSSISFL